MSNGETTRTPPDRRRARASSWLRRWQRRGRNGAASDDDHIGDRESGARAGGAIRPRGQPPPVGLRALEQPDSRLGRALHARSRSRVASDCGPEPNDARYPGADARQPARGQIVASRSLIPARHGSSPRSATCSALSAKRKTARPSDRAQGACAVRAPTSRGRQSVRRVEGHASAVRAPALIAIAVGALALAGPAYADSPPPVQIGISSQQAGPGRAIVRARIAARDSEPGREDRSPARPVSNVVRLPEKGGAVDDLPDRDPYPPLASDSALARASQPFGPGSFWYPVGPGRVCIYAPGSVLPCYTLVGPGGAPGGPGLDPGAIAASVADRLPLLPGRIQTSPRVVGLTGTDSWFWLDPAPRTEELTVALAGETVTVTAEPNAIEWRFGDEVELAGGPGRPYRAGPPPAGAVLHLYETRCLPGDQGRNPYVLGSCGSSGYGVEAVVAWRISYSASGPIDASGALPTRTTATSIAYPVSEARGFLVPGAGR
jgi:hypothetical protein